MRRNVFWGVGQKKMETMERRGEVGVVRCALFFHFGIEPIFAAIHDGSGGDAVKVRVTVRVWVRGQG
jgi:hypothetical protein